MEEFYFNKEFKEQSDFDFDHYQYLFGQKLQARLDELEDPQQQQLVGIVRRPRSSRHRSGGSEASDPLGTLLHVSFRQTDATNDNDNLDDDAFTADGAAAAAGPQQPPSLQQQVQSAPASRLRHSFRLSSGGNKLSGIPAPVGQRRVKSRDPSPQTRGPYDNGFAENGRDQAQHQSQTHQMNRPKTTGQQQQQQQQTQQLRRPVNYTAAGTSKGAAAGTSAGVAAIGFKAAGGRQHATDVVGSFGLTAKPPASAARTRLRQSEPAAAG